MRHLLRLISLRYLLASPGRSLLTLFGILLGVSVVFAIDVVNSSVMASFRGTIDRVAGKTALTVGAGTGIAEELLDTVRAVEGGAAASPLIEQSTRDEKSGRQMMVLGVDTVTDSQVRDYELRDEDLKVKDDLAFLNDPHAVIITNRFAERTGLRVGEKMRLDTINGIVDFTVRGTLAERGPATVFGGDLLLMDVFAAQVAFGRGKRFDHIDIVPADGVTVDALKARLEKALEGKAAVSRPQRRSQETERLLAGFSLGLKLIGLVAMFVGGFIIYNALAIAVAQRRREIGIWRALGVTRAQVLTLFIGEAVLLGGVGALGGLAFGMVLARAVLKTASETISTLYATIQLDSLSVTPANVIGALSLGVIAAVLAAFFPARRASFVEPASVMRKHTGGGDAAFATAGRSAKIAAGAAVVAGITAYIAHVRQDYLLGYCVAGICALVVGFIAPVLTLGVGRLARWVFSRSAPAMLLGSVAFVRNAGRNSVAIAAFGIGLANVVNTDAFVSSMKYSTVRWIDRSVRADLLAFIGENTQSNIEHPMPESVGDELRGFDGVEFVDPYRMTQQTYNGRPFKLASHELERYEKYNQTPVVEGDMRKALAAINRGEGLAASESFAREFKVKVGDKVALQTAQGLREFSIALVYVDFNSELGILSTTREVYKRFWNDPLVDSYSMYLRPGVDSDAVRTRIVDSFAGRQRLVIATQTQYRAGFMSYIDGSFVLMRGTELVAIIVAVLGIINTLLVSVLDRRTEIGVLKAIGADRKQVLQMLMTEAALIGFAASIIGICFGALFSAYIVRELLRFQVGWELDWRLSWSVLVETFVLGQLVTAFAVWWPVRSATKVAPAEALQYE
ncbi:MAG: FtsX-like permease family protein [Polyangiales bacterium]